MVRWQKLCLSGLCLNSVFAPYCMDWEPTYPPKHIRAPPISMNTTQICFRHPPDNPVVSPRNTTYQQTPTDTNRHRQTLQDTDRCCLSMSGICPLASVVVCWHVMFPGDVWGCLGDVWGVCGGCLSGIYRNWRRSDVLGGYVGSQSLKYGAKTLFRHSPVRHNFCHLTTLRHWNIKMVAYKLSKKYWVMHFFAIFSFVREKLLVTVALDHSVRFNTLGPSWMDWGPAEWIGDGLNQSGWKVGN